VQRLANTLAFERALLARRIASTLSMRQAIRETLH
jgi:hypothetical protein